MVQLALAAVLLAGCGSGVGSSPDDSNETATSAEENGGRNEDRNAGRNGGQGEDQNGGRDGGGGGDGNGGNGGNGGNDGGGGNGGDDGDDGEKKKYYEVGGPTLDSSYPAIFGDFGLAPAAQCLAVSNSRHPRPVRITGVAISQRPSSPKAFFLGPPANGPSCGSAATADGGRSVGPCEGAELPPSTEEGAYCELWVQLRQVAPLDYYGTVTMTVESDCVAIQGGGPYCERLDESANPSAEHPAAIKKPFVAELRVCLAEPRPVTSTPRDPSETCEELRSQSEEEESSESPSPTVTPEPQDSETPTEPAVSETPDPETQTPETQTSQAPDPEVPASEAPAEPPPSEVPQPGES